MKDVISVINEKELNIPVKVIAMFVIIATGFAILGNDMQMLIRWDLSLFGAGLVVLPLNYRLFRGYGKAGYFFARILGIGLISYVVWLLSRLRICPFGLNSIIITVVMITLFMYLGCFFYHKCHSDNENNNKTYSCFVEYDLETVISVEIAVLLIHVLTTWLLGLKIPGNQTERLMDLAFLITIDKTDYMAPLDMWAAGNTINYYYFGHYLMALISKISFVDIKYGYSLAVSMIMTLSIVASYVLVNRLLDFGYVADDINNNEIIKKCNKLNKIYSVIGGVICSLAVNFAGNCHYIVFYKIVPAIWDICGFAVNRSEYWFADSTRYIGYIPEKINDRTISEFPFYSYIIGDLHAHVIDIVFVLLIITVAISYGIYVRDKMKRIDECVNRTEDYLEILNPNIIIIGFVLGIISMTNYWDYLIYFVVCVALIVTINMLYSESRWEMLIITLTQVSLIYFISWLIGLPFMLQFDKMINGIAFVENGSYIHQLVILWGLPITVVILLAVHCANYVVSYFKMNDNCNRLFDHPMFFSDVIVLILGICAIGLVLVPEIIFVKDIYIETAPRANTMFKLTYQAYIMFGICIGYIFVRLFREYFSKNKLEGVGRPVWKSLLIVCFLVWIITMGYPFTAVRMWMGDYKALSYLGLDSSSTIMQNIPDEEVALEWINSELTEREVILTAAGSSYSDTCIISALSGHPTVLGWITHEWLWRNGYDFVEERQGDIEEIYNGSDVDLKKQLCKKYNVDYIFVSNNEYAQYPEMELIYLQELGDIVFYNNDYGTYIIKVRD